MTGRMNGVMNECRSDGCVLRFRSCGVCVTGIGPPAAYGSNPHGFNSHQLLPALGYKAFRSECLKTMDTASRMEHACFQDRGTSRDVPARLSNPYVALTLELSGTSP